MREQSPILKGIKGISGPSEPILPLQAFLRIVAEEVLRLQFAKQLLKFEGLVCLDESLLLALGEIFAAPLQLPHRLLVCLLQEINPLLLGVNKLPELTHPCITGFRGTVLAHNFIWRRQTAETHYFSRC